MPSTILMMALSVWACASARAPGAALHWDQGHIGERTIPAPLSDHPGNVYLDSETVRVTIRGKKDENTGHVGEKLADAV